MRRIERRNGIVQLEVEAGRLLDPTSNGFVDLGLPYGAKPRLVLYHLNAEALRTQSPCIHLEDSLTAFVHRTVKLDTGGRTIKVVKEQLNRLAASSFRLGFVCDGRAVTVKTTVVDRLQLWAPTTPAQRTLWPTTIEFSAQYFESLRKHAVPLDENAIARLSHSALCLDIYTWLAQRLHRIAPSKNGFVPWASMKEQFGRDYRRMNKFREKFLFAMRQVRLVYPDANLSYDGRGLHLRHSRPPVPPRVMVGKFTNACGA